ncbi:5'-nucleotidase [Amphibalanus amphitrite]|uniref:5'-nucleotidase n=1 Tax=Amphibalanus amphitrite TaxID=1232801 RepID=A0A6A4WF82_AMPAM|nr:5'-nucleotidase [Amphibalanus amphitrite]
MCHKTMIKMYGELQIGIISYINKESLSKSIKGITILDEVEALNAGISELESMSEDISIILALGYSHHALDKRILRKVPKINLIISGNSFAMFYNGTPPSGAHKDFDYPLTIHHSESGNGSRPVTNQMVVGNYFHMLYAGKLKLVTTNQEVSLDTQSESNPVYMHGEKDPDTQKLVEKHAHALSLILGQSIGFNSFLLDGSHRCRHSECSMGSLVADAMVEAALQSVDAPPPGAWTVAAVALLDSHRVSSSLERGAVYRIDMRNALRNDSSLDVLRLTGAELRGLLENSTRRVLNGSTGFLQVSGVQVVSRPAEDDGPPQLNISVVCAECLLARYEPLNDSTVYSAVVTASFAARLTAPGGPLTASVANRSRQLHGSLRHAAADYISKLSPVFIPTGDRLMLHLQTGTAAPATGAPPDGWRLAAAVAAALLVTRVAGVA